MSGEGTKKKKNRKKLNNVIAFSSIGFQMLVTILLFAYLGKKLDESTGEGGRTWSLILTLTGVAVALYFMIKGFLKVLQK
ncbi:MAG: AtpZ/AtpI family protein [Flavobacteriales bacterium]|nr:AtpZ/AtpI family protein [Flavobacteriales bacterium]